MTKKRFARISLCRSLPLIGALWLSLGCQGTLPVTIQFTLVDDRAELNCGDDFVLGTSTTQLADLRMYVHAPELLDEKGQWHHTPFMDDGVWQTDDVALLDFEDATGRCVNGSSQTRRHVEVASGVGRPEGFRFKMGVPGEENADFIMAIEAAGLPFVLTRHEQERHLWQMPMAG